MAEDHFQKIYATQAAKYDAMVSREDHEGNILTAIEAIVSLQQCDVVEMGAGTGRLTRLLVPKVKSLHAYDVSPQMLKIAQQTLTPMGYDNWQLSESDNRNLNAPDSSADLCIAGWSFGHATTWYGDNWQTEIEKSINEMERVLKKGGTAIILETMGTGQETPAAPNDILAAYYGWLITRKGFSYTWIRTDYKFESVEEADELTRFFFGDALADRIVHEGITHLPECTGIWWKLV